MRSAKSNEMKMVLLDGEPQVYPGEVCCIAGKKVEGNTEDVAHLGLLFVIKLKLDCRHAVKYIRGQTYETIRK